MSAWQKVIVAGLAGSLFIVGFVGLLTHVLVRDNAVQTGFYMRALDETHAFDRVYSELLADPELTRALEPFFGSIGVDRSLAVSTLRFVAPPDQLRSWTEITLDGPVRYVRGDAPYYSGELNVVQLLEKLRSTLATYITQLLVAAPMRPTGSQEEFERELELFSRELEAGRIPSSIPLAHFSPEATNRLTNIILRPLNPSSAAAIKTQVSTYISLNDIVGAVSLIAPYLMEDRIAESNRQVLDWLGGDPSVDPTSEFAEILTKSGSQVGTRLSGMRESVNTYSPPWLLWASIAVMTVAFGALLWTFSGSSARLIVPGLLLCGVGLMVWAISTVSGPSLIESAAGKPLAAAEADAPEGWGLPVSARTLVGDINDVIFKELATSAGTMGLLLVVPGSALLLMHVAVTELPSALRGKYDWVFSRELAPAFVALGMGGIVLLAMLVLLPVSPGRATSLVCNGFRELCDRPYNEVVFPATHNSMATSSEGWLLPSNDVSIREQLEDGVRVLLIDTYYWQDWAESLEDLKRTTVLPPEILNVLDGVFTYQGPPPQGAYLCHSTCWLGAISMEAALSSVRQFLEKHPHEVVTLIIQDSISSKDTEAAFLKAGLAQYLFTPEYGESWPTLGEMIDSGERLVVMAEKTGSPPDWYVHAWHFVQDTPFFFTSPSQFSCELNRGVAGNPLFLMNHWINRTAPDRVDAARVNTAQALIERARECEQERGQLPNYIAVNFHRLGGLFEAVEELNGIGQ
jgi:hypothetical protein